MSIAYSSEGTHFTANGTGGNQVNLYRNSSTHSFDGTKNTVYEFDLKTTSGMALYMVDNTASRRLVQQNPPVNTWSHIKWEYNASNHTVTPYIDGVEQTTVDLSSYDLTTIGLQLYDWQGDIDIWIKELKVYNG